MHYDLRWARFSVQEDCAHLRQNAPAWVWFVGENGDYAELPKTASGKIMKHVLREWGKELSGKGIGRVVIK